MKSYYQQLKPIANKIVKFWKNDFSKYDKEQLSGAKNLSRTFIWLARETGTHLIELLYDEKIEPGKREKTKEFYDHVINRFRQEKAFLLNDGKVKEITLEEATRLVNNNIDNMRAVRLYG